MGLTGTWSRVRWTDRLSTAVAGPLKVTLPLRKTRAFYDPVWAGVNTQNTRDCQGKHPILTIP
jgi:hypothetical protein